LNYWGSVCNISGLSGIKGSPLSGRINVLFPYKIGSDKNKPNKNYCALDWMRAYNYAK
jgi:hypothetical protein